MTAFVTRRGLLGARALGLVLATLVTMLVAGVVTAAPADAHAVLVHSTPADGARVNTPPETVELTFDESVQPIPGAEQVISSTGARADRGDVHQTSGGTTLVMTLKPGLPKGSYSATWRVVSADTHIVSGSVTFGIGQSPHASAPRVQDHTRALAVTDNVAQGALYAGLVLLLGVPGACRLLWPWALAERRTRLLVSGGWLLTLVSTAVSFLLEGPRAANGSWRAAFHLADVGGTLGSVFGAELLARTALLLCGLPLVWRLRALGRRPGTVAGGAFGLALLVSVAVTGHESVGTDVPLALVSATGHMAAMALWLGGLASLALVVLPAARVRGAQETLAPLRRWSVVAFCCVGCLILSGEYQAARQITPVQALWSTRYGVVLLIKIGVVALVLVAARFAQRRVVEAAAPLPAGAAAGATSAIRSGAPATALGRAVRIELALAAAVLCVTAVLVSEPPAATTFGPARHLTAPLGPDHADVDVDTTRRGPEAVGIRVLDAHGRPVAVQSVTASLSSAHVSSLGVTMRRSAADRAVWHSQAAVVPLPGTWTLTVNVAVDEADAYSTAVTYDVW